MDSEIYREMFRLEQVHWWFQARAKIVLELLRRYLPPDAPEETQIADLGCGCGLMLALLRDRSYKAIGMDAFDEAVAFSARRGVVVEKGFLPDRLPFEEGRYDAALLLDVLEHLDDDTNSVAAAARLLKPGGILLCTVPAYQWLWAKRDEHHQHKRRYNRARFRSLFEIPSLKIETVTYYNTTLFPIAAAARLATRIRPPKDETTDLRLPPGPINAMLESTFAMERHLIGRVPLPFGLSLLSVSRRV